MKILVVQLLLFLSVARANNLRGLTSGSGGANRSGGDFDCVMMAPCGCLAPSCCCLPNNQGGYHAECAAPICEKAAENRVAEGPCNGGGYYTVKINGEKRIVCMGGPAPEPLVPVTTPNPNRDEDGGDQPVPIDPLPNDVEPEQPLLPKEEIMCTQDAKECVDGSYVSRDPANDCQFKPCPTPKEETEVVGEEDLEEAGQETVVQEETPPDIQDADSIQILPSGMCTKDNWNLEGNGAGFECSSNDDCKYGCCGTGQVAGKCISPYINPSFASFMGCMPEFSKCEVNRAGLEPPPSGPTTEPEFAFGIGTCQPGAKVSGRVTECCTSSFDCQNYGYNRVKVSACCDKHRMQCVPEGVLEGMQDIVCL
eukprot:CAMPEP_0178582080 /NCGR_PEP_ID=MMETSP0697-20121206/23534_1 /TAXON_ID=265572 /ORGANISM="Extubocellulus spinifer, Strain CCMP396" /LENGTH=366 /DNA_ID=CAMNT_0020217789 /DNA_START=219 /DNA_END=1319 /DNA_ORIENTATION=+